MNQNRLTSELRTLAKLLSSAAASVEIIANEVEAGALEARPMAAAGVEEEQKAFATVDEAVAELASSEASETEPTAPPWEAMAERAIELLRADPKRVWRPAELSRAVRDSGIALSSLQGVHFGLLSRLRQLGAIEELDAGFHASALLQQQAAPAPSSPDSEPVVAAEPKVRRELPWAQIVPAAMALLRAEPDRLWGQSELVRAVRDSGVPLDNLQGIHFGLTARLSGLGAVDIDDAGRLRLGVLVGGHAAAAPETARTVSAASAVETAAGDEVDSLAEEIDACELFLESMSTEQRTAQLAVWAGRARELQDAWKTDSTVTAERRGALRRVFGRLSRITRDQRSGWVDALTPDWSMSWQVYVAWHRAKLAGEPAPLSDDELRTLARGQLRGLLLPARKHVSGDEVAEVLEAAAAVLEPGDDDLREVERRFERVRRAVAPLIRRAAAQAPSAPAPVAPVVPRPSAPVPAAPRPSAPPPAVPGPSEPVRPPVADAVLAITRGKRAVIVGGTGGREDHRQALQDALGLSELDWASSERGATGQFARTEERIRHGSYELVLFLAGYTSHKSVPLLRACKATGVALVYLPRGYSVAQVAKSIEEQLASRRAS